MSIGAEPLRNWVQEAEVERGARACARIEDKQPIAQLESENRELGRANEIAASQECSSRPIVPSTFTVEERQPALAAWREACGREFAGFAGSETVAVYGSRKAGRAGRCGVCLRKD